MAEGVAMMNMFGYPVSSQICVWKFTQKRHTIAKNIISENPITRELYANYFKIYGQGILNLGFNNDNFQFGPTNMS